MTTTGLKWVAGPAGELDVSDVVVSGDDPGAARVDEATCWPSRATAADLEGLPPYMISVNEVDPLCDEGLGYYRKLPAAGVPASAWMNPGLSHEGEILFRATMPDVCAANVRGVSGFAHSLRRRAGR